PSGGLDPGRVVFGCHDVQHCLLVGVLTRVFAWPRLVDWAGVVLVGGRADAPPVPPGRPHVQDVLEDDNIMPDVFAEILKEAFDGGPVTAGRVNEFDELFDVEQDDVPY